MSKVAWKSDYRKTNNQAIAVNSMIIGQRSLLMKIIEDQPIGIFQHLEHI